jgi:hypothetical protein
VSKETISRITDTVVAEIQDWPPARWMADGVAVFIDAIVRREAPCDRASRNAPAGS